MNIINRDIAHRRCLETTGTGCSLSSNDVSDLILNLTNMMVKQGC